MAHEQQIIDHILSITEQLGIDGFDRNNQPEWHAVSLVDNEQFDTDADEYTIEQLDIAMGSFMCRLGANDTIATRLRALVNDETAALVTNGKIDNAIRDYVQRFLGDLPVRHVVNIANSTDADLLAGFIADGIEYYNDAIADGFDY